MLGHMTQIKDCTEWEGSAQSFIDQFRGATLLPLEAEIISKSVEEHFGINASVIRECAYSPKEAKPRPP